MTRTGTGNLESQIGVTSQHQSCSGNNATDKFRRGWGCVDGVRVQSNEV